MVMSEYNIAPSPGFCVHIPDSSSFNRSLTSQQDAEDRQPTSSSMECFQTQYYHCPTRQHYQDLHSHDDLSDHAMMTEDDSSLVTTSGQQYWLDDRSREASPHYGSQGYGSAGHHHGFSSYGYEDCQQLGDHHYYQYSTLSSSAPNLSMETMDSALSIHSQQHQQQSPHQQSLNSQLIQSHHHTMMGNGDVLKISNVPVVRIVKRRNTANRKERRRTQSINTAFADLRDCIPNVPADTKLSKTSGRKQRCRSQNMNSAYTVLRQRIPNVPEDTKLSKIKTLRLATSYISYLMGVLESDLNEPVSGFRAELPGSNNGRGGRGSRTSGRGSSATGQQQNQYCANNNNNNNNSSSLDNKEGLNDVVSSEDPSGDCRRSKGRTGWPQHVWALELKQEQHNI